MTKLIFLRHGETLWNKENRFQGHTDIALNANGRKQARQAAKRLACVHLDAVYSSDLSRAHETAEIAAEPHKLPVVMDSGLRERNGGVWQGLTTNEIHEKYPDLSQRWKQGDPDCAPEGGETINELCDRAFGCVLSIAEKYPDQTVLIVSHGGPLKAIFCEMLGMPRSHFGRLRLDNVGISIIQISEERRVLTLFNDTVHTRVSECTEADSQ